MVRTPLGIATAFIAGYLLLDWVSYIHPMQQFGITPWNPQPAIAIALLMLGGQRWLPAVLVAASPLPTPSTAGAEAGNGFTRPFSVNHSPKGCESTPEQRLGRLHPQRHGHGGVGHQQGSATCDELHDAENLAGVEHLPDRP